MPRAHRRRQRPVARRCRADAGIAGRRRWQRGFGTTEFEAIGHMIADVLDGLAANGADGNAAVEADVRARVTALTARFPIYG